MIHYKSKNESMRIPPEELVILHPAGETRNAHLLRLLMALYVPTKTAKTYNESYWKTQNAVRSGFSKRLVSKIFTFFFMPKLCRQILTSNPDRPRKIFKFFRGIPIPSQVQQTNSDDANISTVLKRGLNAVSWVVSHTKKGFRHLTFSSPSFVMAQLILPVGT